MNINEVNNLVNHKAFVGLFFLNVVKIRVKSRKYDQKLSWWAVVIILLVRKTF